MKRPYSDADLLAYSAEHVWYEVWMFLEMVDRLTRQPAGASSHVTFATTGTSVPPAPLGVSNSIAPPPGLSGRQSTVTENANVESFMAHLRTLIDFLFILSPRDTDVVAADFCAEGTWRPAISQRLKDAKKRVDKELAHLTTDRIEGSSSRKYWDAAALAIELRPVLRDFVAQAVPGRLSPRVQELVK